MKNALRDFKTIETLAPNYIDVNHNIASCYYKMNLFREAKQYLLKSIFIYPNHLNSIKLLSFTSFKLKNMSDAMTYCIQYLKLQPKDKNVINLRNHLIKMGK